MRFMKFLRNSAGMGLIEVMTAIAITGGLSLTISKLLENQSQGVKQNEAKSENMNLKNIIQDTLNDTTACKNTFITLTATDWFNLGAPNGVVTIPNIKDKINGIKYSTASTNIRPLTITSITLANYNTGLQTGNLIVRSTFMRSKSQVQIVKPIIIPLNFTFSTVAPFGLTACSTMAVGGEWMLGGNAGTTPGTDYIGTSDAQSLVFKTNATERARLTDTGLKVLGTFSMGNLNTASGNYAQASGEQNNVSGNFALGAGFLNNVTGEAASAFGKGNIVSGVNGHAAGEVNLASGLSSVALGYYNLASGSYSVASGYYSMASGTNSFAASSGIASGTDSIALGASAYGRYSTAMGKSAITGAAGSPDSTTVGYYSTAIGSFARATAGIGSVAISSGQNFFEGAISSGNSSVAIGRGANASAAYAYAIGDGVLAPQANSWAIGRNVQTAHATSMIIGVANNAPMTTRASFMMTLFADGGVELCAWGGAPGVCNNTKSAIWNGAWLYPSDRNLKKDISPIDKHDVLKRLNKIEVSSWRFKEEDSTKTKRVGVMAQDFYKIFRVPFRMAGDDKTIDPAQLFFFGILGIQALTEEVKELKREIATLKENSQNADSMQPELNKLKKDNKDLKEALCELHPAIKMCHRK